jgi:hypothetical protein
MATFGYIPSKIVVSSRLSGAPASPLTQQAPLQAVKLQTKSLLKISSETMVFLIETLLWGTEIIKCKGSQTKRKHIC